ncbi:hypothetical protein PoB_000847500 [Plakobranchus ocellatus]|uniref:Secreted protein n=1 Tax=Plakobranchus ocellatus TaxID=259542 RepID=A0AAV3YHH8_9GAST|nr:hypothetical protein PoB_000847500 [Plakobranchus ocellatus]
MYTVSILLIAFRSQEAAFSVLALPLVHLLGVQVGASRAVPRALIPGLLRRRGGNGVSVGKKKQGTPRCAV